jgi:hypothetical protein
MTVIVAPGAKPQEIQVFLSSTFRDMEAERNHLVKQVFAKVRAACLARQVGFTEIDLRWGVTEEELSISITELEMKLAALGIGAAKKPTFEILEAGEGATIIHIVLAKSRQYMQRRSTVEHRATHQFGKLAV